MIFERISFLFLIKTLSLMSTTTFYVSKEPTLMPCVGRDKHYDTIVTAECVCNDTMFTEQFRMVLADGL